VLTRRSFLAGGLAVASTALAPARAARAAASDLDFASALDAARAIRGGQVSAVELTTRMLDRIQQHNGKLNAIVALAPDAVERARAADEARARRDWWGPFHGVPCTIKDTFEVAGVTTTAGSPTLRSHVPARDAAVAARLRAAGMIILGKTNVPLFAGDWQSYNAVYGQTNNPWDVTRTPGGSTGGGAAALAAGLTYLEPGSDHRQARASSPSGPPSTSRAARRSAAERASGPATGSVEGGDAEMPGGGGMWPRMGTTSREGLCP